MVIQAKTEQEEKQWGCNSVRQMKFTPLNEGFTCWMTAFTTEKLKGKN
jgi:hypothetical protein